MTLFYLCNQILLYNFVLKKPNKKMKYPNEIQYNCNEIKFHKPIEQNKFIIKFEITNSDSKALICPLINKKGNIKTPYDGVADLEGIVSSKGKGIIIEKPDNFLNEIEMNIKYKYYKYNIHKIKCSTKNDKLLNNPFNIEFIENNKTINDTVFPDFYSFEVVNCTKNKFDYDFERISNLYIKIGPAISETISSQISVHLLFVFKI